MRQLLLLGLYLAAPAAAQQQPPPDQTITVTGERESSEAEARREASRFFQSHAVRTRIGQLARWHQRICARAGGLEPEMNARIANRVMDIAETFGIPTNRAEMCSPNIRIGFTSEPQRLIEQAARRNRLVIGFHYASQRDQVMRVRAPVQAWYVTTTRGGGDGGYDGDGNTAEIIDEAGSPAPGGRPGSRLTNYVSSGLAHVLILADMNHVEEQDADSIAELVAFLALAQTPVAEACDPVDTILNLMNPDCPDSRRSVALTRDDIAYLRALYTVNPEMGPNMQRGSIVLHMADTLTEEPEGQR